MKITISNNLYVEDMPAPLAERAYCDLTVPNPEYVKRERLDKWLDNTEPELTLMRAFGDGSYILPRGYCGQFLSLARGAGTPVNVVDKRLVLPKIDLSFKGELRDYQQRAFDAMAKESCGVLVAPCGSGKTAIGMALIARRKQPALVLVHTLDLLKQTRESARRWLNVEAGTVGDGAFDIKPVTVGTVQTVRKHPELARMFGLVLLDECQHSPALTYTDTLQTFPAAYRYGLTATPKRDDGLECFMTAVIGPTRHVITRDDLRAANVLVIPHIEFIRTAFNYQYVDDWTGMISALTNDAGRNNLIYRIICHLLDDGRRVLALSQRVGHCEALYRAVERFRPGVAALAIGTRKKERIDGICRISSGEAQVLFATQLADEGLDAPILDAVLLMTPQRSESRTIQRAGRVLRALDGKPQPLVIDLVDDKVGILRNQARTRFFNAYRQLSPGARLPEWLNDRRRAAA
ncbi:MAG: DEAD/DEAH box helicase [Synergistaceae bacterium]|jgi:superfamily II DNA or RNA helicase|nr:DEAD/DEAH box helicase [Synergistaceae bacterium]